MGDTYLTMGNTYVTMLDTYLTIGGHIPDNPAIMLLEEGDVSSLPATRIPRNGQRMLLFTAPTDEVVAP